SLLAHAVDPKRDARRRRMDCLHRIGCLLSAADPRRAWDRQAGPAVGCGVMPCCVENRLAQRPTDPGGSGQAVCVRLRGHGRRSGRENLRYEFKDGCMGGWVREVPDATAKTTK